MWHLFSRLASTQTSLLKGGFVELACLDLEGVLVPEIWVNVAQRTGIEALRATTREVPDYDVLMRQRLAILEEHGLCLKDIQNVIDTLDPLPGAPEFLQWLRANFQVIILSDTFYEFAAPLMRKLGWPTLFCNYLDVDERDRVVGYQLRQPDQKRMSVISLHQLKFRVIAAGDSYNDTSMLKEADKGIFFRPPEKISAEFPDFPVTHEYAELSRQFCLASERPIVPQG
ncbi:MAG: phosphoserine/homoserine phosphotransferase [Gammaproteobacteria bacterium]|jgi:phosphoserine/homoserine phosphotransferase